MVSAHFQRCYYRTKERENRREDKTALDYHFYLGSRDVHRKLEKKKLRRVGVCTAGFTSIFPLAKLHFLNFVNAFNSFLAQDRNYTIDTLSTTSFAYSYFQN